MLIAVLLPQIVLDAAPTEVALDRPVEAVEEHASGNPVTHADGAMEGDLCIGVEATEAPPTELDRAQAGEDEARRRDQRPVRRRGRIRRIRPQRIVVADAFRKAQNRQSRRVLVVDAVVGAQLGTDQRAHLLEHLVGELAASKLGCNDRGVVHCDAPIFIVHICELIIVYANYFKPISVRVSRGFLRMPHGTLRHEVRSAEPICPGVQYPHWEPSYLMKAACTGWS